jgi:hypothetical protein
MAQAAVVQNQMKIIAAIRFTMLVSPGRIPPLETARMVDFV